MKIMKADISDLCELMDFFDFMCTVLDKKDFMPKGNRGGFPSKDMVKDAIKTKCLYKGVEDGKIIAAYFLNGDCDPSYKTVKWGIHAEDGEFLVMHALRVHPDYGGRGYSKRFVEHAIEEIKKQGKKALRLDVLEGNTIPEKMYISYGFKYIDTVSITYEDIGEPRNFKLFEYIIKAAD